MNTYYFELTDTFGGELNYCWVKRFKVTSKSIQGAVSKLSKLTGFNFRYNGLYYKAKKACIGLCEIQNDFGDIEKYYTFEEV